MISQKEAIAHLAEILGREVGEDYVRRCTGDIETCPHDECMICGCRDCPDGEPLHYHHDGCPCCDVTPENRKHLEVEDK